VKLQGVKKAEFYDVDFVTSRGFTAYDQNYDTDVGRATLGRNFEPYINNNEEGSSYRVENQLWHHYRQHPVNAVEGHNLCLL
jgi:hypothetical protein